MLKDIVLKNRSYRGYDESRPVTKEELTELVELARCSASGMNKQPLKYYIAYKKEEVEQILALTKWAAALKELQLPYPGTHPTGFIVICQDREIRAGAGSCAMDIGIAAQTILLGAVEKGLGGCMIGSYQREALKTLLRLSETIEPQLVVAIGKPIEHIVLTDVKEDGNTGYYRDETGTHYVPKRALSDILLSAD